MHVVVKAPKLWYSSKGKAHTKFLHLDIFTSYRKGSKYSKHKVDIIAHTMLFDDILKEEILEVTVLGFSVCHKQ